MSEPIYIVSGFPRSGTSMMMRAIDAGGIRAIYSDDSARDRDANPYGYFEVAFLSHFDFATARGKVVKVIDGDYRLIPPGERCRIVYMRRDPEEIRQSFARRRLGNPGFVDYAADSQRSIDSLIALGHEVHSFWYADVLSRPVESLLSLGWPIDAVKAAAAVDPSLYRIRRAA